MPSSHIHVYGYENQLFVTELATTEAGFFIECEPVTSVPPSREELRGALQHSLSLERRRVPTPRRDEYPSVPHIVRAAGARTMVAFERRATLWAIEATNNELKLETLERLPAGGWGTPEKTQAFPRTAEGMDSLVVAILDCA